MEINGVCRVKMHYTLKLSSGEVVQTSFDGDALEFEYGRGEIIPGLESHLEGMNEGEEKSVVVSAADAYGDRDPKAVVTVPRSEFPAEGPLEAGMMFQLMAPNGQVMHAQLVEASESEVTLDLNHPLAGEDLHFEVKIESVGESQGPTIQGCGCGCGDEGPTDCEC